MDDLISRQAVAKFLNDWLSCLFENCHKQSASDLKMIIKDFKNLPSAQPERKTGRWIPDNTDYYRTKFICSACGESEEVPTMGFGYAPMWGYCPNCGADMRGEQE